MALESLFAIIAKESSSIFNRTNVSRTLGIGRSTTLNQYLALLRDTYMISEAPFYSEGAAKKRARKESKMYVNDVGMRNAMCATLDYQALTDASEVGKMAETVAFDHTRRMTGRAGLHSGRALVSYWHDGYEVDMVAELPQTAIPIEVRYREGVRAPDLKGLGRFEKRFGAPVMMAVTKNQLELGGGGHGARAHVAVSLDVPGPVARPSQICASAQKRQARLAMPLAPSIDWRNHVITYTRMTFWIC